MKGSSSRVSVAPGIYADLLRDADLPEYERIKRGLVKVLNKHGGYEPDADDLYVDRIARAHIYLARSEIFLDPDTASEHTFARIADSQTKLWKTIETAMRELAVARKDRMAGQTQASLMKELREAMLRGLKNARH